jgi:hypothetical protein
MKIIAFKVLVPALLILVLPVLMFSVKGPTNRPFQIRIVDEDGRGLSRIQLTTDNGIVCYTQPNGNVMWSESSIMDRDVYFRIESPGYRFPGRGTMLRVTHGGHAELKVFPLSSN